MQKRIGHNTTRSVPHTPSLIFIPPKMVDRYKCLRALHKRQSLRRTRMFRDRKPCRSRMHLYAVRNCMSVRYLLRKRCVRTTCLPAPKVRFKVFLYCNVFVRRRVLSTRSEASMENDIVLILSIQTCRDPRKESYSRKKYCFFFFF